LNRVAKRYAKALFELAIEQKKLDRISEDMELLRSVLAKSEDFAVILSNPLISEQQKLQALSGAFGKELQTLSLNFLDLLTEKRRLNLLPEVLEAFKFFLLDHENKLEGEVVSAIKLSSDQIGKIRSHVEELTGKKLVLEERIDTQLIGGFVVKVQDIVIDNSIRSHLERLRERLSAR